jgi:hypothetical protein
MTVFHFSNVDPQMFSNLCRERLDKKTLQHRNCFSKKNCSCNTVTDIAIVNYDSILKINISASILQKDAI